MRYLPLTDADRGAMLARIGASTIDDLFVDVPEEARAIARKLEFHYTPKHGSWLNMAELELSVLARQCLRQRLPDQAAMREAVEAWAARRNAARRTIEWQFTTEEARPKLRRLSPAFHA